MVAIHSAWHRDRRAHRIALHPASPAPQIDPRHQLEPVLRDVAKPKIAARDRTVFIRCWASRGSGRGSILLTSFTPFARDVWRRRERGDAASRRLLHRHRRGRAPLRALSGRKVEIGWSPRLHRMTLFAVDLWLASRGMKKVSDTILDVPTFLADFHTGESWPTSSSSPCRRLLLGAALRVIRPARSRRTRADHRRQQHHERHLHDRLGAMATALLKAGLTLRSSSSWWAS